MIIKVNRFIRLLLAYDFVLQFGFGLLAPIFAIFVLGAIHGSTLGVIGTATACYWIARVVSTVPLSRFMDRTDGEKDEYYFLLAGSIIISLIPLMFLIMTKSWHLYLIQFIHGLANSMAVPGWRILFTDHLDKGSTGYEWSLDDIVVGCSVAASAYIGANLAELFGYPTILIILSVMSFTAVLILIPLRSEAMSLPRLKQFLGRRKFFSRRRSPHARSRTRIKYGAV